MPGGPEPPWWQRPPAAPPAPPARPPGSPGLPPEDDPEHIWGPWGDPESIWPADPPPFGPPPPEPRPTHPPQQRPTAPGGNGNIGDAIGGGIEIGGTILGLIGGINTIYGNIASGALSCNQIIAQGTSAISQIYHAARQIQFEVASAAVAVAQMIATSQDLPQECLDILNDILGELGAISQAAQGIVDECDAILAGLAKYNCATDSNVLNYIGGPTLGMLTQQILGWINDLTSQVQQLAQALQTVLNELANFPPDSCRRRRKRCPPSGRLFGGIIASGPFAGQAIWVRCKPNRQVGGDGIRVLP